ncbi:hypothetical protein ATCC90586_005933 [Pythium insidiosum]|nr:hypothetical protein ATCC90586_005933 [Pythium insidiosum]
MAPVVDLAVYRHGANAVEYSLSSRDSQSSGITLRRIGYTLWLGAALAAGTWHGAQRSAQWMLYSAGVMAALALAAMHLSRSAIVEEAVLVIPSVGVQLRQRRQSGRETRRFIDAADITAVVVNEAISFGDVVYYIAFMRKSQESMSLAFQTFRLRIGLLQEIFRDMEALLFPDGRANEMRIPEA